MDTSSNQYPDHLNPFGDEEDDQEVAKTSLIPDDYPDHLDPFGEEETLAEDYDDSLNPFASEVEAPKPEPEPVPELDPESAQHEESQNQRTPQETTNTTDAPEASVNSDLVPEIPTTPPLDQHPPKPLPRKKRLLKKEQHRSPLQEKAIGEMHGET